MNNMMMHRTAVLSAALAAGAVGFCINAEAQDQRTPPGNTAGQKTENAIDNVGKAAGNAVDRVGNSAGKVGDRAGGALSAAMTGDVRNTVATATEAAVAKGGLNDLVERFCKADRDRLSKDAALAGEHRTLDGRIAQFQKDWKEKYNQDFSIAANRETIYNDAFAKVMASDVTDSAQTASDRMDANRAATDANRTAVAPTNQGVAPAAAPGDIAPAMPGDATVIGDTSRTEATHATLNIAASHGMSELNVPLVREGSSWKIDVPDNLNGIELGNNVLKELTAADEMKADWPADPNEAYRAITHHILTAVLNANAKDMNSRTGVPPMNDMATPAGAAPAADGMAK